jgi:hypothetical protein
VTSAVGSLPTGIVAVTARFVGSIRETVESRLLATHSVPAPNASATGPSPTRTRPITLCDTGSSFSTVALP